MSSKSMSLSGTPISRGKRGGKRQQRKVAQPQLSPDDQEFSTSAMAVRLVRSGAAPWSALTAEEAGRALAAGWGWDLCPGEVWRAPSHEAARVKVRPDRTRGPRVTRERRAA